MIPSLFRVFRRFSKASFHTAFGLRVASFALLLCGLIASPLVAMSVQPLLVDIKVGRGTNTGVLSVTNTFAQALPIEVSARSMNMTQAGDFLLDDKDTDDFLVFPPQVVLQPGQTQTFRLQWLGDVAMTSSKSYVVTVAQLPVKMPEGVNGVQMVYNFQVMANVAPISGSPALVVESANLVTDATTRRLSAQIVVANSGPAHGYLSGARLRMVLRDTEGKTTWQSTFEPTQISNIIGYGLVQNGGKRTFSIPLDIPPGAEGVLTAEVLAYVGLQ